MEGTARICGCTDVRPRVVHGSPAGGVYLSTDLYCTRKLALGDHTLIYAPLKSGCHVEFLFGWERAGSVGEHSWIGGVKSTLAGRVYNYHSSTLLVFLHIDVTIRHQIAGVDQAANHCPFCSCSNCGLYGSNNSLLLCTL